jgi:hypothetical protein
MFPSTLDEIPKKWYKIEEACGHTSNWAEIKENFVQDFEFNPEEEHLKDATCQIKIFLENPSPAVQKEKENMSVDGGSTSTCNFVLVENKEISTAQRIDMENIKWPGQSFQWKKDHPTLQNHVKSVLSIATEHKEDQEQPDFPKIFTKIEEGEHHLDEAKPPEWMDAEIKQKNSTYQMMIDQKWYE